jgi:hypothetical protein
MLPSAKPARDTGLHTAIFAAQSNNHRTEKLIMKHFLVQHRNSILAKALYSSATISLFLYVIIRGFSYEFPMTWFDEFSLFVKVTFTGTFLMSLATIGCASLYKGFESIKRHKKSA